MQIRQSELERLPKLPKWAQDLIHRKLGEIDRLERLLAQERDLRAGTGETNVSIDRGIGKDRTLLPANSIISFYLGNHSRLDVHHAKRYRGPNDGSTIELYAVGGRLVVAPSASNVVFVEVER